MLYKISKFSLIVFFICQMAVTKADVGTIKKWLDEYTVKLEDTCKQYFDKAKKNKLKIALASISPLCALQFYGMYLFYKDKKKNRDHAIGKIILLSWLHGLTKICSKLSLKKLSQSTKMLEKKLNELLIPIIGEANSYPIFPRSEVTQESPGSSYGSYPDIKQLTNSSPPDSANNSLSDYNILK